MSVVSRMEPERTWAEHVVVRMLRRWAAGQMLSEPPLPSLVALGGELGVPPEAAVAAGSFFQITEACLGRPLVPECCCSRALSADERATLTLLAAAPEAGAATSSAMVPHGLPGVLVWAATSLRIALGEQAFGLEDTHRRPTSQRRSCPFGTSLPPHG